MSQAAPEDIEGRRGPAEAVPSVFDELRREVASHESNAWAREAGYAPLFVASEHSRVLIISQAPGRRAQETGIPWNDPSGIRLRSWLGLTDEEFYDPSNLAILPMDFYYPGKAPSGDLPPRSGFADTWHPLVLEQLTQVRLTILIGAYAQRHYLGRRGGMGLTETVRAAETYLPYFPIVHPSPLTLGWRARNPWFEAETAPRLATLVRSALDGDRGPGHPGAGASAGEEVGKQAGEETGRDPGAPGPP
ncbi:uracil-DNA glycosylase family protein [Herbiconiux solani]|uniref:uracil-DNA glycosylase family protein n=1 Tax=Herbiconiux solani TaxID=661329 RepID=UPI000A0547D0|nr:uracil-DNA glycosylase family protein [Herbiconiux solani]